DEGHPEGRRDGVRRRLPVARQARGDARRKDHGRGKDGGTALNGMQAIEASSIARWMREALWAYPAVEAIHILALGLVVGSIVIVDLRLLGLSRDVPVSRLSRHALPWTVGAFVVAMCTGLLMF